MARVSLIVLERLESPRTGPLVSSWRDALETAGHEVELLLIAPRPIDLPSARYRPSRGPGHQTSDAIEGLREATGEILVVADALRPYDPADLPRIVAPLVEGRAEVAVADGRPSGWRALVAVILRPVTGSSDPFAGLIALSRDALARALPEFKPVGRRFAFEILARSKRNRIDIPVEAERAVHFPILGIDDLRHLKRIADDKLGNVSRLLQFCVVGASGMVVDLTCYALFQYVFSHTGLADGPTVLGGSAVLAVSGALAIGLALTWNFTLNRYLTFSYARKGSIVRQFVTYVLSNALGIALSFTLRLYLPRKVSFFAGHKLAAAVVGIIAATGISFTMSRWLVFRQGPDRPVPGAPTRVGVGDGMALAEPASAVTEAV